MYEKKRVTLDHWTIQKRNKDGKFHRGRPKEGRDVLERTDREPSQMAPDIEQSTLYKLLPAKPTVSNYLTHSKTSRKSPTPPDQAFDPISTEQRPNRICIYIYTILLTTNSRITLGRIDPGSPTMHERFDHRARRISRNLSARDSCALYLSLSLSLFVRVYQPRFYLRRSISLFFPFSFLSSSHLLYIIAALASLFRSPSLPPSPVLRSLDFYLSFQLLPLCSRAHAPQRVVGNWWEGRSCKMWMDEEGGESWWRCKQRLSSAGGTGYLLQISRITWPAQTAARA